MARLGRLEFVAEEDWKALLDLFRDCDPNLRAEWTTGGAAGKFWTVLGGSHEAIKTMESVCRTGGRMLGLPPIAKGAVPALVLGEPNELWRWCDYVKAIGNHGAALKPNGSPSPHAAIGSVTRLAAASESACSSFAKKETESAE